MMGMQMTLDPYVNVTLSEMGLWLRFCHLPYKPQDFFFYTPVIIFRITTHVSRKKAVSAGSSFNRKKKIEKKIHLIKDKSAGFIFNSQSHDSGEDSDGDLVQEHVGHEQGKTRH